MSKQEISRRHFVLESCAGIGSVWLLSNMPEIVLAQEHAHRATQSEGPVKFEFFTAEQAAEIEAIAAQIIPTDDTPGAREARVIYFIDRALATFAAEERPVFVQGLKDLRSRMKKRHPKHRSFSDLPADQQIRLLKSIEKTQFFESVRTMTIIGMFANPSYGGNHDKIGWRLNGYEDEFFFKPPFGFYDRNYKA
jgi:gluconate 2-dehydrogenase gamma chain